MGGIAVAEQDKADAPRGEGTDQVILFIRSNRMPRLLRDGVERRIPVATRSHGQARARAAASKRRKRKPEINQEEEEILKRAQIYMLFEAGRPMFWTVAGIREEKGDDGSRRWIIAVNLRYPTGFEGYLGDLLYDGMRFTELTDLEVMRERGRQIAADPERDRMWHELRASTFPPEEG
jgi:hypothetical protein